MDRVGKVTKMMGTYRYADAAIPNMTNDDGLVNPLLYVLNNGSCDFDNDVRSLLPQPKRYGDDGLTDGQRTAMNNVVINTAPTPASDNGANANNDSSRQSGYKTVPVSARIQNCLDVQIPAVAEARPVTALVVVAAAAAAVLLLPCNNV